MKRKGREAREWVEIGLALTLTLKLKRTIARLRTLTYACLQKPAYSVIQSHKLDSIKTIARREARPQQLYIYSFGFYFVFI